MWSKRSAVPADVERALFKSARRKAIHAEIDRTVLDGGLGWAAGVEQNGWALDHFRSFADQLDLFTNPEDSYFIGPWVMERRADPLDPRDFNDGPKIAVSFDLFYNACDVGFRCSNLSCCVEVRESAWLRQPTESKMAMGFDRDTEMYLRIFRPGTIEEGISVVTEQKRFVCYTSADTAMKLLRNRELRCRNANVMNDFSEIAYGLDLIEKVFSGPEGARFREAVDTIFPGTIKKADELISGWVDDCRLQTFIACVSVHNPEEDRRGRLSMWRAYGNTALVVKNTPMTANTDLLAVYSMPVLYLSEAGFSEHLSAITKGILDNRGHLERLGQETLVAYVHGTLFRIAIATKHPGFKEEKEWRLYYRPTEKTSPAMTEEVELINGVPQTVHKLRLANEPENGLFGADVPSLLDRVIVGPTQFPYVSYDAFVKVLKGLGVSDAASKVVVSDIPLRVG